MENASSTPAGRAPSRAFQSPRPRPILMWILGFVNRWALLRGLPVLRHVPFVRDLPGVRGYFRIRRVELPYADRARLRRAVNSGTAAFLAPNHPEFGLDWMIDKEISTLVAPRMASWAAHEIVASAPAFWGANNLIANNGGDAAMEYSIRSALDGHAVLLHPEGAVRWTADVVHPLFPGVADMAVTTARRVAEQNGDRPVFIVPVVWKLRYVRDVSAAMHAEMTRIERALELPWGEAIELAERFYALQENILARQAERFGVALPSAETYDFFDRQDALRAHLLRDLESRYGMEPVDSMDRRIRRLERAIRAKRRSLASDDAARSHDDVARVNEIARLGGFRRDVYSTRLLTQEQIAESLKRIRAALLTRGLANTVHNMLPRPYGPRVAHVRVPEPIRIDATRVVDAAAREQYTKELLEQTRAAQQRALDAINAEVGPEVASLSHPNPFVLRRPNAPRRVNDQAA